MRYTVIDIAQISNEQNVLILKQRLNLNLDLRAQVELHNLYSKLQKEFYQTS